MMVKRWPGTVDLTRLSEAARRAFLRRQAIVEQWDDFRRDGKAAGRLLRDVDREFMEWLELRGDRTPRSTLFTWRRAYLADGLKGLLDQRARRQAPDRRFLALVRQLYLEPGRMLSMHVCHLIACEEADRLGWRPCTLRETRQYIRRDILPALTTERGA